MASFLKHGDEKIERNRAKPKPECYYEDIEKNSMDLIGFYNSTGINKEDWGCNIPSRYQPIRFRKIIDTLMKHDMIRDIAVFEDKKLKDHTRSRVAFISHLTYRGYLLSQDIGFITKLETLGNFFEHECRDKHAVKLVIKKRKAVEFETLDYREKYYCPRYVADHIKTNAPYLGLNEDALAILYVLIAANNHDFGFINGEIEEELNSMNKQLKRKLEDIEEVIKKNKIDLSELDDQTL